MRHESEQVRVGLGSRQIRAPLPQSEQLAWLHNEPRILPPADHLGRWSQFFVCKSATRLDCERLALMNFRQPKLKSLDSVAGSPGR